MAIIANLHFKENGSYEGQFKTLTLDTRIKLEPIGDSDTNDKKPDYRVKLSGLEVGAGWKRISDNNSEYVSIQIDDPIFPNPINANLIASQDGHILLWSRK